MEGGSMRDHLKRLLAAVALLALIAAPVAAQDAMEPDPYAKSNNAWITLDGTVESVMPDQFTLDYGDGHVTVEFDDTDRDAEAYKLASGDKVRVSGMIDDDLWETTSIEAVSVYVENLDTYFYASAVDEEDRYLVYDAPILVASTVLDGVVTEVNDDSFALHTGTRVLEVHVGNMAYDPLDSVGYQRVDVGDRVSVRGEMDTEFWDIDPELEATSITMLHDS
jgi:uncharacterized protein YdeI (BOF family)